MADGTDNEFQRVVESIDALEHDPERHLSLQIDDRIRAAIRAAKTSGKPAKVAVEIVIKAGPDRRVSFTGAVKAALPNPPTNTVTLFADEDGAIHSSDPMQVSMPASITAPRARTPTQ